MFCQNRVKVFQIQFQMSLTNIAQRCKEWQTCENSANNCTEWFARILSLNGLPKWGQNIPNPIPNEFNKNCSVSNMWKLGRQLHWMAPHSNLAQNGAKIFKIWCEIWVKILHCCAKLSQIYTKSVTNGLQTIPIWGQICQSLAQNGVKMSLVQNIFESMNEEEVWMPLLCIFCIP